MKKTFKSNNIACTSCVNLIKVSLEDKYGQIDINLDLEPKEITLEIKDKNTESEFKKDMAELGFEIIGDKNVL